MLSSSEKPEKAPCEEQLKLPSYQIIFRSPSRSSRDLYITLFPVMQSTARIHSPGRAHIWSSVALSSEVNLALWQMRHRRGPSLSIASDLSFPDDGICATAVSVALRHWWSVHVMIVQRDDQFFNRRMLRVPSTFRSQDRYSSFEHGALVRYGMVCDERTGMGSGSTHRLVLDYPAGGNRWTSASDHDEIGR